MMPHPHPAAPSPRRFALLCGILLLAGCGTSPAGPQAPASLDISYPLTLDGPARQASPQAVAAAAALSRGINLGNMFESPKANGDWGVPPDPVRDHVPYVHLAADAGFSHVRLPVRWSNHASPDASARLDESFARRVDAVVDAALARGLYVVLDMHHYRQLDGDPLDAGETRVEPEVVTARFLALWQQIALRYRDRADKLIFELYNEPHGRLDSEWNGLMSRALRVVRASNPTRLVMVGPNRWNSADTLSELRLPPDADLLVTVHTYEPFNFTHQGADWVSPRLPTGQACCDTSQTARLTRLLDVASRWGKAHGHPIHLGEFGAYSAAPLPSRIAYTRLVREAAEARGIGWSYWELASGFGVYAPAKGRWVQPLRDALLPP